MSEPLPIDAVSVVDAVLRLEQSAQTAHGPVAAAWCRRAIAHLWERLDVDLRGGCVPAPPTHPEVVPASTEVVADELADELKRAAVALEEAAHALKEKARLPLPASRAHQAAQRATLAHKELVPPQRERWGITHG